MGGDFHHRALGPRGLEFTFGLHLGDAGAQFGPLLRREFLGIVGARKLPQPGGFTVEAGIEQYRGRNHRAAEGATASFIYSRDAWTIGTFFAVE